MFAVRRIPSTIPRPFAQAARSNATLATTSTPSDAPSGEATTQTQGRKRRKIPPKRPEISLSQPRTWNRALGKGVIPAYDLALALLRQDSQSLKAEVELLRAKIAEKEKEYTSLEEKVNSIPQEQQGAEKVKLAVLHNELEKMIKKADIVEVQSEVNLPAVRWTVANAMADMSKVSHRHLIEQKWRKDGDLDLLMERLYQMGVVPDILPEINPSVDLHVIARTKPGEFFKTGKVQAHIVPGDFVRPKQTLFAPKLGVKVFHTDVRLYTMLMVDLDVPDPERESYTTFLHWMKPNIPLSATSPAHLTDLNTHTTYVPPHPQRGTPYHRYVCLLLLQPPISKYSLVTASRANGPTSAHLDIPIVPDENRVSFNVREFAQKWNLNAASGGGAHMFREIWEEDVSRIYTDILKKEEPRYGRPPKINVYDQLKHQKKYI